MGVIEMETQIDDLMLLIIGVFGLSCGASITWYGVLLGMTSSSISGVIILLCGLIIAISGLNHEYTIPAVLGTIAMGCGIAMGYVGNYVDDPNMVFIPLLIGFVFVYFFLRYFDKKNDEKYGKIEE